MSNNYYQTAESYERALRVRDDHSMLGNDPEVSVKPQGDRSHPADWGWPEWWGSNGYGDSYIPPRSEWPEGWKPATFDRHR